MYALNISGVPASWCVVLNLRRQLCQTPCLWRLLTLTVGMVGDLQGIAGKAMPKIPSLDMPLLEASTDPEAKVA